MGDVWGTGDVAIYNEAGDKAVQVTADAYAVNRLACDVLGSVNIDYDESPTRYQLKTAYDATGVAITTSDTTLYSYTGAGVIDLVAVNNATTANWGVVINVDGTERLRISMGDLGSTLGLTDSNFDIVTQTANKQFRWKPTQIGFTTSFEIEAYTTTGTTTLYYMILFRERVA